MESTNQTKESKMIIAHLDETDKQIHAMQVFPEYYTLENKDQLYILSTISKFASEELIRIANEESK